MPGEEDRDVQGRRLDIADNFSFSCASAEVLAGMVRAVAAARRQAITILCTNLRGTPLVEALEREIGIFIHDFRQRRAVGVAPRRWRGPRAGSRLGKPVRHPALTCPQYLVRAAADMDRPGFEGAKSMCSPSPRTREEQERVWGMIRRGVLDVVSSDHSGYSYSDTRRLS